MTSFRRWLLLVLPLWGIPAFFFCYGVGLWHQHQRHLLEAACRRDLAATLDRAVEEIRFDTIFEAWMKRDAEAIASLTAGTPDGERRMAEIAGAYPPGTIKFFFFDGEGTLRFPAAAPQKSAIEAFFREARIPCAQSLTIDPTPYAAMEELAGRPDISCGLFKMNEQGRTFALTSWDETENPLADRGFLAWREGSPGNRMAGMLAFISAGRIPPEILMKTAIQRVPPLRGGGIGFELDSGVAEAPPGLSPERFRELLQVYGAETSSRFRFGERLVEVRSCGLGRRFIAAALPDSPPCGLPATVLVLYAATSFLLLITFFRSIRSGSPLRISLPLKLLLLFLMGVVFPLIVAGGLISAGLDLKREEIRLDLRRESLELLDGIEADYRDFLAARERFFLDLGRCPDGSVPSPEAFMERLRPLLDATLIDLFILGSHEGKALRTFRPVFNPNAQVLSVLPRQERTEALRIWLRNGLTISYNDVIRLYGHRDFRGQSRTDGRKGAKEISRDAMLQALTAFSRDIMAQALGKAAPGSASRPAGGIPLDALVGPEYQALFTELKASVGRLAHFIGPRDSNHFFLNIIGDAAGMPRYSLVIAQTAISLEHPFLLERFARERGGDLGERARAIAFPHLVPISVPRDRDPGQFAPLIRQMEAEQAVTKDALMTVEGREMQVVLRRSAVLRRYVLVGLTPVTRIEERLSGYRRRAAGFLALAVAFCLTLGFLLYRRFLVPVADLARGIEAVRGKRFEHRVPFRGNDELGHLGQELNRTIAHLKDMELASVVQASLYPREEVVTGSFVARGCNVMTKAIGGDYFDFLPLPDGRLVVAMGDVSGHGFSAALVAAMAKAGIAVLAPLYAASGPGKILQALGHQILEILGKKMMMTCYLAVLDPREGTLAVANAGQCSPVLLERGASPVLRNLFSNPLGITRKGKVTEDRFALGERAFVLYSDCFVESTGPGGMTFGYERFLKLLDATYQQQGHLDLEKVFAGLRAFTGPGPWSDDATIVVIERRSADPR